MEDKVKEKGKSKKAKVRIYSFPTVSICPRCHGQQTRAVSTQRNVQYRKCLAPVCRQNYHVMGTRITQITQIKKTDDTDQKKGE